MSKFKEGDEVQISNKSIYGYQGIGKNGEKMRGVITHRSSDGWWSVTWENNTTNSYLDDDLEPYKKPTSTSEPEPQKYRFQVGDTVIGNEEANTYGVTVKGWRGTVVKLGKFDFSAEDRSGTTFNGLHYEYFDLAKSEPEPINIEALLEEANRLYPIGTMYKELNDKGKATGALREANEGANWVVRGESIDVGLGYVYANGKWAEIVNEDKYVVTQRIPSPSGGVYDSTLKGVDISPSGGVYDSTLKGVAISAAVIRNAWVDPSTKQLPDAQTPIIVSRSKNKSTIKVL